MKRLALAALLLLVAAPAWASPLFFSGAEEAKLPVGLAIQGAADCTRSITAGVTADQTHVYTGAYAWKLAAGSSIEFNWGFGSNATTFYQFRFYPTANPGADTQIFRTVEAGTVTQFVLQLTTTGTLAFSYKAGAIVVSGTHSVLLNQWNLIELKLVNTAVNAGMEAKLNGVVEFSSFATAGDGNAGDWVRFMPTGADTWLDDMVMDNAAYPGGSRVIARQGIAGTPTDNGWTKNSCTGGTIDGCWSNTPVDLTSTASTTTTQDQTMLISSFLVPQAGHGSEGLGGMPDTVIKAVAITFVGNISNGGTGSGGWAARRILSGTPTNGGANGSPTAGVDSCLGDLVPWTTSVANLANMEAGVGLTTPIGGAQTDTVSDLWVNVLYSPRVIGHKVHVR